MKAKVKTIPVHVVYDESGQVVFHTEDEKNAIVACTGGHYTYETYAVRVVCDEDGEVSEYPKPKPV